MSAISGRTRLGLEILAAGAGLGLAGDTLLRAVPWGLNALLCTTGLVTAAAWLVSSPPHSGQRRRSVARRSRAPHRLELRGPRLRDAPSIRRDRAGDRLRGRLPE